MNELQFHLEQVAGGRLRVTDVTPPGDGESYPAEGARDHWRLTLLRAGRPVLVAATDDARGGDWEIDSRDYGLGDAFASDVYEVRLELLGRAETARRLANYFIRTPLEAGQTVWIRANGAYFDYTDAGRQGTELGGDWAWQTLGTYDDYSYYQVRAGASVVRTDRVIVDVLQETTYDPGNSAGEPVVLRAGSVSKVLCLAEREAWAGHVLSHVRRHLGKTHAAGLPAPTDQLGALATAGAYLDLLESGLVLDPGLARGLLRLTQVELKPPSAPWTTSRH